MKDDLVIVGGVLVIVFATLVTMYLCYTVLVMALMELP
jgi:hypothetical protein